MRRCFKVLLLMMAVITIFKAMIINGSEPPPQKETTETITTETVPTTENPQEVTTIEAEPEPIKTPPNLNVPLSEELETHIYEQCRQDDDLYCLVIAMIKNESSFNEYAVSDDGHDHGLMQLRDMYYDELIENYNISDPTEPFDNVTAGISMMQEYIEKYEYKNLALMAYNCGEAGAKSLWKSGVYSTEYTEKVLNDHDIYMREVKE